MSKRRMYLLGHVRAKQIRGECRAQGEVVIQEFAFFARRVRKHSLLWPFGVNRFVPRQFKCRIRFV